MKHKLRKFGVAFGVLLVVFCLAALVLHINSKGPLETYKAELRATGEKLTMDELVPRRVPLATNGAEILRKANALSHYSNSLFLSNAPTAMRMIEPGRAIIGWAQPELRDDQFSNTWEEAEAALGQSAAALALLDRIVERPVFDFELDYKQGVRLLLPHLTSMRQSAQLLSAATICDLHRGDTASAVTHVRAQLALANGWTNDNLVISELVRRAVAGLSVPLTWELLQSSAVTGDQLAAVQQDWAEIDFAQSGERALVMERAFIAQNTSNLRTSNSPFSSFVVFGGGGATTSGGSGEWYDEVVDLSKSAWRQARLRTKETWWKVSASYSDELLALEGEQVMIEAIRQVRTNGYFKEALDEQDKKLKALGLDDTTKFPSLWDADPADLDPRFVISQSVTTLSRFLKRMMIMESGRQMAVTAVALKRYQLRFGTYPADVSDLIPDFLPAVTRDPMDGKPLRYRLNPDGTFLLYSVGQDGTDDGGDVQPASPSKNWYWSEGRDYVWPQPASDAEIQKYRDDRAPRSR